MALVWYGKSGQPGPVYCSICCRYTLRTEWDSEREIWARVGCVLCKKNKIADALFDAMAHISDDEDN